MVRTRSVKVRVALNRPLGVWEPFSVSGLIFALTPASIHAKCSVNKRLQASAVPHRTFSCARDDVEVLRLVIGQEG